MKIISTNFHVEEGLSKRPCCIIIAARKGYRRQARGLISRALKKAGIKFHRGNYVSDSEMRSCGGSDARYTIDITDEEAILFQTIVTDMGIDEGWDKTPIDMYHD